MDHLERFDDLFSAIQANEVHEDYLLWKIFKYSLLEMLHIGLSSYHQDLFHLGLASRTPSSVILLMTRVLKT